MKKILFFVSIIFVCIGLISCEKNDDEEIGNTNNDWTESVSEVTSSVVHFVTNGADSIDDKTYDINTKIGELPIISLDGYEFIGWFCSNVEVTSEFLLEKSEYIFYAKWNSVEINTDYTAPYILLNNDTITYEGDGISMDGNNINIENAGTYNIYGSANDAQICVNAPKKEISLVLNGINLSSSTSAAIYIIKAKNVNIESAIGSKNYLSDAEEYTEINEDSEPNACVFSKADLVFSGYGEIQVLGNYNNGIQSKDSLTINSGTINVASSNDGIKGKDYVEINGGDLLIKSGKDGIVSTNDEDERLGYVLINNGTINISAEDEGIQAVSLVKINAGVIDITSKSNAIKATNIDIVDGCVNVESSSDGLKAENEVADAGSLEISGGEVMIRAYNDGLSSVTITKISGGIISIITTAKVNTNSTISSKAIKSDNRILIEDGIILINSTDNSIDSKNVVEINGAKIIINSTYGKGITGDGNVTINNGIINIEKASEGIESKAILRITGGTINIVASDDGLNAGGGNTSGGGWNGGGNGGRPFSSSVSTTTSEHKVIISGGNIYIDSTADGIDSNGNIEISGGMVIVNGPTTNMDGALDSDGQIIITGGTLLAIGSSGMAETPSSSSTQKYISTKINIKADNYVSIRNSTNDVLITFRTTKNIQSIIFSSAGVSGTCRIYYDGTYSNGEMDNIICNGGQYTSVSSTSVESR